MAVFLKWQFHQMEKIAFIARGEVFVTSAEGKYTKRLTSTPERERFLTWSGEGDAVIYSSERKGKWSIFNQKKYVKKSLFSMRLL